MENVQCAGVALMNGENIFLIHPTGFHHKRSWGIPKGRIEKDETPDEAALREFREETGIKIKSQLSFLCMSGYGATNRYPGKDIHVYITNGDGSERFISCNNIDYGPNKGLPENDDGQWFHLSEAKEIVMKSQQSMIDLLIRKYKINEQK